MSMLQAAIILAIIYYIVSATDNMLAWDATWRPLFAGFLTGLALGDLETGLIMGAKLEAIYMGISAIGGVIPSDPMSGTIIPVAFVILTKADMNAAIALAVPVGTLIQYTSTLCSPIGLAFLGLYDKFAATNNQKAYILLHYIYIFIISPIPITIVIFLAVWLGVGNLGGITEMMPQFLLNGLDAAGGMLVAVGFGILTSMIWSKELGIYFFVGFALAQFLGLSTVAVAVFAIAIAIIMFTTDNKIAKASSRNNDLLSNSEEDLV